MSNPYLDLDVEFGDALFCVEFIVGRVIDVGTLLIIVSVGTVMDDAVAGGKILFMIGALEHLFKLFTESKSIFGLFQVRSRNRISNVTDNTRLVVATRKL